MSGTALEEATRHAVIDTPIGSLTMVRDDVGLTGLYFPGHWTNPDRSSWGPRVDPADDAGFHDAEAQLGEYFAGARTAFDVPMHPRGSDRARRLWQLLSAIPFGATVSYGALAQRLGGGISARAVGGYVGHNPISIFIPCHRVVGSTGKLTGYAGGLQRKHFLLELENAAPHAGLW